MGTGWNSEAAITGGRAVTTVMGMLKGKRATSDLVTNLAFSSYNKAFAPNRTDFDWIAADTRAVDRYIADPQCGQDATIGLFHDMLGGFRFNQQTENLRQMDPSTPIYFFSGEEDPVGQNGVGVRRVFDLFRKSGCSDVTMKLYPGGRHEMLNEINKEEVYANVLAWLEAHV